MSATELDTKPLGLFNGGDVYESTGNVGNSFPDTNTWLTQKISAGITGITCFTHKVIVCNKNGLGWAAFDEPYSQGAIRKIFEIR